MLDLFGNEIIERAAGSPKIFTCLAASNHSQTARQSEDYYATEPKAVQELLAVESFSDTILEPCVGGGAYSRSIKAKRPQSNCARHYRSRLSRNYY